MVAAIEALFGQAGDKVALADGYFRLIFGLTGRGERNHDELAGVFVEHKFKPTDVAAIDFLGERSILLVLNLDATGRAGPGHGDQAARSRRVRWRYSNGPHVRHSKKSQRSIGCTPFSTVWR